MKSTKTLGIVGTLLLALASAACGGDNSEGGGGGGGGGGAPAIGPALAGEPSAESGDFGFEAMPKAIVRRSTGGRIDVRLSGASNVSYEIEGLPAGIAEKEHSDASITLAFSGSEPAFGEHAIKLRAKSGNVVHEGAVTLLVADDPGTLDVTFGQKGLAQGGALIAAAVALDASGRIVVAGADTGTNKLFVSRFLPNGAPDTELDGDGTVTMAFDPTLPISVVSTLALGADGSIVVGGFATVDMGIPQACIAKLDAKGAPFSGFGKDGRTCVKSALLTGFTMPYGLVQLADGAVLMAGMTQMATGSATFVAKLSATGDRDEDFAVNGVARFTASLGMGKAIVVDREGRIVVAGAKLNPVTQSMSAYVLRLDQKGNADPWFGSGGMKVIDRGASFSQSSAIALGPNDEVFVAGQEEKKGAIIALDPQKGEPLASFGTNAGVTFAKGEDASLLNIAWDDGKVLAVGSSRTGAVSSAMVVRVSPDGAPDKTYGQAGSVTLPGESALAIALAPSSRAVVLIGTPTGFMLARTWR